MTALARRPSSGASALEVGTLGAPMTGGGFGGCAVALVPEALAEPTVEPWA
jgi:galactokinase